MIFLSVLGRSSYFLSSCLLFSLPFLAGGCGTNPVVAGSAESISAEYLTKHRASLSLRDQGGPDGGRPEVVRVRA